jgi:hypothetical protein
MTAKHTMLLVILCIENEVTLLLVTLKSLNKIKLIINYNTPCFHYFSMVESIFPTIFHSETLGYICIPVHDNKPLYIQNTNINKEINPIVSCAILLKQKNLINAIRFEQMNVF